jgi:hypothetical protein
MAGADRLQLLRWLCVLLAGLCLSPRPSHGSTCSNCIVSPSSFDTWVEGETREIVWRATAPLANVSLLLVKGQSPTSFVVVVNKANLRSPLNVSGIAQVATRP